MKKIQITPTLYIFFKMQKNNNLIVTSNSNRVWILELLVSIELKWNYL
jgi:hypothetical protein